VVQDIERTEGCYDVGEEFGEVRGWYFPEGLVLECNCRAKLILEDQASVQRAGLDVLGYGICGERFVLTWMMARHRHTMAGRWEARSLEGERRCSGLEYCLERLEGKEARREYYVRLEERTVAQR
jgi:hypothetical protein